MDKSDRLLLKVLEELGVRIKTTRGNTITFKTKEIVRDTKTGIRVLKSLERYGLDLWSNRKNIKKYMLSRDTELWRMLERLSPEECAKRIRIRIEV